MSAPAYFAARAAELRKRHACVWCRDAVKSAKHVLCASCRKTLASRSRSFYAARRAAGLCVWCGVKAAGWLCDDCAERRRERRA